MEKELKYDKSAKSYSSGSEPRHMKFYVYGEEMLDKKVGHNGSVGRIYLPGDWVGHRAKIIRID